MSDFDDLRDDAATASAAHPGEADPALSVAGDSTAAAPVNPRKRKKSSRALVFPLPLPAFIPVNRSAPVPTPPPFVIQHNPSQPHPTFFPKPLAVLVMLGGVQNLGVGLTSALF